MSKIIDLSPRVPQGFKGPPSTNVGVQFEVKTKHDPGAYWQSGQVYMSLHTGCHVESALHCFENGEAIDQVSLDRVIGIAVILDLTPVEERAIIDVEDLERGLKWLEERGETMKAGDIILLRTDWAQRAIGTPTYFPQSPGLTEAAARWLVEKRPKCIGCDFFEEPAARQPGWTADQFVVHQAILGAEDHREHDCQHHLRHDIRQEEDGAKDESARDGHVQEHGQQQGDRDIERHADRGVDNAVPERKPEEVVLGEHLVEVAPADPVG